MNSAEMAQLQLAQLALFCPQAVSEGSLTAEQIMANYDFYFKHTLKSVLLFHSPSYVQIQHLPQA